MTLDPDHGLREKFNEWVQKLAHDLQFIRINGMLVGGLVGLVIYAVKLGV